MDSTDKKVIRESDLSDGQVVYLKTRGACDVKVYSDGQVWIQSREGSWLDNPILMRDHGFYLSADDYIEYKSMIFDKTVCKCCHQSKVANLRNYKTGKEVYLEC